MKDQTKIKKLVLKSYDDVYKTAQDIIKAYGTERLPLNTLKVIIDKISFEDIKDVQAKKFIKQYKDTLDLLYQSCEATAKSIKGNEIPMPFLKICIDTLKESFTEGFNSK